MDMASVTGYFPPFLVQLTERTRRRRVADATRMRNARSCTGVWGRLDFGKHIPNFVQAVTRAEQSAEEMGKP